MSEEKHTEADETGPEKAGQPPKKDLRQAMAAAASALTLQWDKEALEAMTGYPRNVAPGGAEKDPEPAEEE